MALMSGASPELLADHQLYTLYPKLRNPGIIYDLRCYYECIIDLFVACLHLKKASQLKPISHTNRMEIAANFTYSLFLEEGAQPY